MHRAVNECPVCQEEMLVTRLRCPACSTELHGNFQLSRLSRLSPEQIAFVETLLKQRANVYRAAEELGISYSTARGRLDDVMRALGYLPEEPAGRPLSSEQRRSILHALSEGRITAGQALEMLAGER